MPLSNNIKQDLKIEAKFHARVASIIKQPEFIAALDEIHDHPELQEKVHENPMKYLKDRGVKMPPPIEGQEWEITAYKKNSFGFRFCIFIWCWRVTIEPDDPLT